jgi:hypothetical protein
LSSPALESSTGEHRDGGAAVELGGDVDVLPVTEGVELATAGAAVQGDPDVVTELRDPR